MWRASAGERLSPRTSAAGDCRPVPGSNRVKATKYVDSSIKTAEMARMRRQGSRSPVD
jgi:hypothetical protein